MKILVTGAAGFIGYHLSRSLLADGNEVIGFDDLNDYYDVSLKQARLDILNQEDPFSFIKGDLADSGAISSVFEKYAPELVINLAAQAGVRYSIDNPGVYINSNIVGFYNILECCRNYGIKKLIYASSSSVYGNQEKVPFSTDDPVDKPISLYAATKKSNELMAYTYSHLFGFSTIGLRFFTVYGPYGRPDMAYFKFTNMIYSGKPIKIYNNGDMLRDFTYVDDIVAGIKDVIGYEPPKDGNGTAAKVFNIGNNHPVKLLDFIETLEKCIGKKAEKEFLPMQPGDVYQTYADISELNELFGFEPTTDIETGLSRFAEWYKTFYNK